MSELIKTLEQENVHRKLLATASAVVLTAYIASVNMALAKDDDRPTVWIELGGQMESEQQPSAAFAAPFMTALTPTPEVYSGDFFGRGQKPSLLSFGGEGAIRLQPENSNWTFSASVRYSRLNSNIHIHHQGPTATATRQGFVNNLGAAPFADAKAQYGESHAILDFSAGKDVGLGLFGHDGSSVLSVGVRIAQFSNSSNVNASGRPVVNVLPAGPIFHVPTFHNYTMIAHSARDFRGVGPSLSWNASAALASNKQDGEFTLDWGINGAVLFGRQKARTSHTTQAYLLPFTAYVQYVGYYYTKLYENPHHSFRSRKVIVPNVGGFVAVSWKTEYAKVSFGYRYDAFFGAMDTGIDTTKRSDLITGGPYASINIGLGG